MTAEPGHDQYVRWRDLEHFETRLRKDLREDMGALEQRLTQEIRDDRDALCSDITEVKDIAIENRRALDQLRGARGVLYAVFGTSILSVIIGAIALFDGRTP